MEQCKSHVDVVQAVSANQGEQRGKSAGAEKERAPVTWRKRLKVGKPAHFAEKEAFSALKKELRLHVSWSA